MTASYRLKGCYVPGADVNDQALAAIELSAIAVQVQLRSM